MVLPIAPPVRQRRRSGSKLGPMASAAGGRRPWAARRGTGAASSRGWRTRPRCRPGRRRRAKQEQARSPTRRTRRRSSGRPARRCRPPPRPWRPPAARRSRSRRAARRARRSAARWCQPNAERSPGRSWITRLRRLVATSPCSLKMASAAATEPATAPRQRPTRPCEMSRSGCSPPATERSAARRGQPAALRSDLLTRPAHHRFLAVGRSDIGAKISSTRRSRTIRRKAEADNT